MKGQGADSGSPGGLRANSFPISFPICLVLFGLQFARLSSATPSVVLNQHSTITNRSLPWSLISGIASSLRSSFRKVKLPPLVDCPDFSEQNQSVEGRDFVGRSAHADRCGRRRIRHAGDGSRKNERKGRRVEEEVGRSESRRSKVESRGWGRAPRISPAIPLDSGWGRAARLFSLDFFPRPNNRQRTTARLRREVCDGHRPPLQSSHDHASGDGFVGAWVDEDERAGVAVAAVGIVDERDGGAQ